MLPRSNIRSKIKVWNVSPNILLRPHDLQLDSDVPFMVGILCKFFDPKTTSVTVHIPKNATFVQQQVGYRIFVKSGMADLVYQYIFHRNIKESKRVSDGRVGLKLKGNILAVNPSSYHPKIIFTLHPSCFKNYKSTGNICYIRKFDSTNHDLFD